MRLAPRIQELHLSNFLDYYLLLQADSSEIQRLATLATNNETYFLRERHQFEALIAYLEQRNQTQPTITQGTRILCAGCSSGEEAYTISFYLQEHAHMPAGREVSIDAFDLDPVRVVMARRAAYRPRSLREMGDADVRRLLDSDDPERYEVKQRYRTGVRFSTGNIVDVSSYPRSRSYEIVFCRNVLIYFSQGGLQRAIDNFAQVLRPGGLLFLGHAESIIGLSEHFETVRLSNCIAYRRVSA